MVRDGARRRVLVMVEGESSAAGENEMDGSRRSFASPFAELTSPISGFLHREREREREGA